MIPAEQQHTETGNGTTNLDGDISFSDLPHVEPDCRNHVFTELARLKHTHTHTSY